MSKNRNLDWTPSRRPEETARMLTVGAVGAAVTKVGDLRSEPSASGVRKQPMCEALVQQRSPYDSEVLKSWVPATRTPEEGGESDGQAHERTHR